MQEISLYFLEVKKIYKTTSKCFSKNNRINCLFWNTKRKINERDIYEKNLLKKRIFALLFTLNIKLNIVASSLKESTKYIPQEIEINYIEQLNKWKLWVDRAFLILQ